MMTGTPPESQLLELRSAEGGTVAELTDDEATLESTPAENLMDLHVTDTSADSLLAEVGSHDLTGSGQDSGAGPPLHFCVPLRDTNTFVWRVQPLLPLYFFWRGSMA